MTQNLRTGELLVREGFVTASDVDQALGIQKKAVTNTVGGTFRLLGILLCNLNLINPFDLYHVLHENGRIFSVNDMLYKNALLPGAEIDRLCKEARHKRIPFISYLLRCRILSVKELQALLFSLFHVPYRSLKGFAFDSGNRKHLKELIDINEAAEYKVLPLVFREQTLLIGITDPACLLFVRGKNSCFLTVRIKAVFIHISDFDRLFQSLYQNNEKKEAADVGDSPVTLSDPSLEQDKIKKLYEQYEKLNHSSLPSGHDDRFQLFSEFIREHFHLITTRYRVNRLSFSAGKEGDKIFIIAQKG